MHMRSKSINLPLFVGPFMTHLLPGAGNLESETVSEDKDAEYRIVYTPRGVIGGITPCAF